jgi:hypothetical protein
MEDAPPVDAPPSHDTAAPPSPPMDSPAADVPSESLTWNEESAVDANMDAMAACRPWDDGKHLCANCDAKVPAQATSCLACGCDFEANPPRPDIPEEEVIDTAPDYSNEPEWEDPLGKREVDPNRGKKAAIQLLVIAVIVLGGGGYFLGPWVLKTLFPNKETPRGLELNCVSESQREYVSALINSNALWNAFLDHQFPQRKEVNPPSVIRIDVEFIRDLYDWGTGGDYKPGSVYLGTRASHIVDGEVFYETVYEFKLPAFVITDGRLPDPQEEAFKEAEENANDFLETLIAVLAMEAIKDYEGDRRSFIPLIRNYEDPIYGSMVPAIAKGTIRKIEAGEYGD